MELVIFFWLSWAVLGGALLSRYNKAGTGLLLGLFLGPVGVLFALIIRSGKSKDEQRRRHEEQLRALTDLKFTRN
jgi:hypothetical protein